LASGDTHRNRPTQFVHAVESFDGYFGFGLALRIAKRMQNLERSDPPPRVMSHGLAEWGIQSVTDSFV
jgi:hypothetical protein